MAILAHWLHDVTDEDGNLLENVQVRIERESDAGLPSLYDGRNDATANSLGNPYTDADGKIDVYTTAGNYKITLTASGHDARVLRNVLIGLFVDAAAPAATTTEQLTGTATGRIATPDSVAALWEKGSDVASAGTISLGEGGFFHITGTTTITDIDFATAKDGRTAWLEFDDALTLTHNATTLNLPGAANITTAAGDRCCVAQDSSDNVHVLVYQRAAALSGGGGRELLTANRTYYVRSDGNDSNTGLVDSAGGAFLTGQKALDVVAALDISTFDVTIQFGAGTRTQSLTLKSPLGSGKVILIGDTTTPANCVMSVTSDNCFFANNQPGRFQVKGFKLQTTTSGSGFRLTHTFVEFEAIDFGACATAHAWLEANAHLVATGNYTISGGSTRHWFATNGGVIEIAGRTITITGTPAFSTAFAVASRSGASMVVNGNTFSGSATGTRYVVSFNASIDVAGGGATYLPGNGAGSEATGGVYA